MRITYSHVLIVILALIATGTISAQPGLITKSSTLGIDEGLADRVIMDISSSKKGIFLLHTPSTIQLYDGENMLESASLPSYNQNHQIINKEDCTVHIDKNNCVTVAQKSPLKIFTKNCISDYIGDEVYKIITHNDQLIVLSKNGTTYKYFELNADLNGVHIIDSSSFELNAYISTITKINNKFLIIDDFDRIHLLSDKHETIDPSENVHPRRFESRIFKSKDSGVVYFSLSQHEGVYKYDTTVEKVFDYGFITVAAQDQKKNIVLALSANLYNHQDFVLFIDKEQQIWEWPELLTQNNRIKTIYATDFNDHIICGTYNGIYYYDISHSGVTSFLNNSDLQSGEFGFVVRSFTKGDDEHIKVIKESGDGVFSIIDGSPELDPLLDHIITYGSVWINYVEEDSTYWISQYNRDNTSLLIKYNVHTKELSKIKLPISVEKFELTQNSIWIVGHNQRDGKIIRYNRENGEIKLMFDNMLKERPLKAMYLSDSIHLFGCRGGIIAFNPSTQTIKESLYADTKDLSISSIQKYKDDYLIGTYGDGLYILNNNLELQEHIKLSDAQAANTPAAFEEDNYGNLWISTFDGIHIYNDKFKAIGKVTLDDGLSSPEFNRAASYKDDEGNLYFGNLNGYTRIIPAAYFEDINNAPLFLDEATYIQSADKIIANTDVSNISILGSAKKIDLKYARSSFTKIQRRTDLSHFDIQLNPQTTNFSISKNSITLENTSVGTYTISAQGRHPGAQPFLLTSIDIKRDINRILGNLLIAVVIALICGLIGLLYIKRERRKNNAALTLQQEMSDLKMKALRSQLNPHFIFNSLNSIQYFIQVNDKQQARDYLTKFARLMRSSLDSSYEDRISVQNEVEQLRLYLDLEKLRYEDKWDYDLSIEDDVELETNYIPSMLVQPVVENAIIHGLSHLKNKKGKLDILFSPILNGLMITINDNGIGRLQSNIINQNKNRHKSRSTSITKKRINLFNRYKNHNIEIAYNDNQDKDGNPSGTTAVIKIKKEI